MTNALLVYPKNPRTFWSYDTALAIAGKRSMFPPTGLLTIANSLPAHYDLRLIDENIRPLQDSDIAWSDVILTSSMGIHKKPLERIIARANAREKPVLAGGPLPTQYHHKIKGNATFFLGEAEAGFVDDLEAIVKRGYAPTRDVIDRQKIFRPLDETPFQRLDLIQKDLGKYQVMALQLTRGCVEHCTFCNIPSLYGGSMRLKERGRFVKELEAVYDIGWRGSVMIVDDNVAGNQEALMPILKDIAAWQTAHHYPFAFFTQASLRIFDNPALMEAMHQAGFDQVFFGIESPSVESLRFMGAQKNLQDKTGDGLTIADKVRRIGEKYFKPQAGLIIGFDKDPDDIAERMIELVMDARISVAMLGPLGILPDTADYTRYEKQDRLVRDIIYSGDSGIFSRQLSYVPHDNHGNPMDPNIVTDRLRTVLAHINSPEAYFARTQEYLLHRERKPLNHLPIKPSSLLAGARSIYQQGIRSDYKGIFWKYLWTIAKHDLADIPDAINYAVEGHHLIVSTRESLKVDDVNQGIAAMLKNLEPTVHELRDKGREYVKRLGETYDGLLKSYARIKKGFREEVKDLQKLKDRYVDLFKKKG